MENTGLSQLKIGKLEFKKKINRCSACCRVEYIFQISDFTLKIIIMNGNHQTKVILQETILKLLKVDFLKKNIFFSS